MNKISMYVAGRCPFKCPSLMALKVDSSERIKWRGEGVGGLHVVTPMAFA